MRDFLRVALERDARSLAFLDEVRERRRVAVGPGHVDRCQAPRGEPFIAPGAPSAAGA